MANKLAVADSFAQPLRIAEDQPKARDEGLDRVIRPKRESENDQGRGVGRSFERWAARIYPTRRVVNIGTHSLHTIRSAMLQVIERIDDELRRRDNGRH